VDVAQDVSSEEDCGTEPVPDADRGEGARRPPKLDNIEKPARRTLSEDVVGPDGTVLAQAERDTTRP